MRSRGDNYSAKREVHFMDPGGLAIQTDAGLSLGWRGLQEATSIDVAGAIVEHLLERVARR